jgi:hypothetical protein
VVSVASGPALAATRPTSGLEEASVAQPGEKAPSIAGTTFDGRVIDLGSPGKPTVLYFYPKASTPG